jgi:hypothetical protein
MLCASNGPRIRTRIRALYKPLRGTGDAFRKIGWPTNELSELFAIGFQFPLFIISIFIFSFNFNFLFNVLRLP